MKRRKTKNSTEYISPREAADVFQKETKRYVSIGTIRNWLRRGEPANLGFQMFVGSKWLVDKDLLLRYIRDKG